MREWVFGRWQRCDCGRRVDSTFYFTTMRCCGTCRCYALPSRRCECGGRRRCSARTRKLARRNCDVTSVLAKEGGSLLRLQVLPPLQRRKVCRARYRRALASRTSGRPLATQHSRRGLQVTGSGRHSSLRLRLYESAPIRWPFLYFLLCGVLLPRRRLYRLLLVFRPPGVMGCLLQLRFRLQLFPSLVAAACPLQRRALFLLLMGLLLYRSTRAGPGLLDHARRASGVPPLPFLRGLRP